jgi:hypothetical protein
MTDLRAPIERPAVPIDAPRCPLCGEPNACAPAASGSFDSPCWCTELSIPPELLARLPAESRGTACICRACALSAGARPKG